MTTDNFTRDPMRLRAALTLVLRRYGTQIRRRPALALPALILPGVGDALIFYAPPLVIAKVLGAFARNEEPTAGELMPYILVFAGVWLAGELVWRLAVLLMTRMEVRGREALYVEAMDELLAKDLAFFHNNFAGSLTKRALGYARRFEDVFDVLCFSVSANLIPLAFAAVVLWAYSPLLIVVLLGLMGATLAIVLPLIRRRQRRGGGGGALAVGPPPDPRAAAACGRARAGGQRPRRARRRFDRQRRDGTRVRAR